MVERSSPAAHNVGTQGSGIDRIEDERNPGLRETISSENSSAAAGLVSRLLTSEHCGFKGRQPI